jgi:hypothetical protein
MRANSRQRDRRGRAAALASLVAPGGKSLSREDERLDQAGHQKFPL